MELYLVCWFLVFGRDVFFELHSRIFETTTFTHTTIASTQHETMGLTMSSAKPFRKSLDTMTYKTRSRVSEALMLPHDRFQSGKVDRDSSSLQRNFHTIQPRIFSRSSCFTVASFCVASALVPWLLIISTLGVTPRDEYVPEADLQLHMLEKREMPPCGKRWDVPEGQDPPQHLIDEANYSLNYKLPDYEPGWKSEICKWRYENCVRLGAGIKLENNDFSKQGHWYSKDGTQSVAFRYWQEQVLFDGADGSGKVYLAHGSTWTCVKETMNALLEDDHYTLAGSSNRNHNRY